MFSISEIKRKARSQLNPVIGKAVLATFIFLVISIGMAGGFTYYNINSADPIPLIPNIIQGLVGTFLSIGFFKVIFDFVRGKGMSANIFSASGKSFLRYLLYSILKNIIVGIVSLVLVFILFMSVGIGLFFSNGDNLLDVVSGIGIGSVIFGTIIILFLIAFNVFIQVIYCFTPFFILLNEEEVDTITSMKYSRALARGSFWKIVLFNISFIGWTILMVIPVTIGIIFSGGVLEYVYIIIGVAISGLIGLYFVPYYTTALANLFLVLLREKSDRINTQIIINPENLSLFSNGEYEDLGSCGCGDDCGCNGSEEVEVKEDCSCGDDCGCNGIEEVEVKEDCSCGDDCGCNGSEEVEVKEDCSCGDDCGCNGSEEVEVKEDCGCGDDCGCNGSEEVETKEEDGGCESKEDKINLDK